MQASKILLFIGKMEKCIIAKFKKTNVFEMARKEIEGPYAMNKDLRSFSLFLLLETKNLDESTQFLSFSRDMRNKNLTTHVCGCIIFSF